ncbi:hypothetical protein CYMTET_29006 [Cymbomonas tetramitiformis]|uniref:Uncharacterized protein n=1 Tax=Cymbomonas tetramitiformis TaxID=36881 RepID=A0AAE0FM44_9CHLO|nr:hypothetical protein CYMTET_29006 [Cymbomonas tetramitiformis]
MADAEDPRNGPLSKDLDRNMRDEKGPTFQKYYEENLRRLHRALAPVRGHLSRQAYVIPGSSPILGETRWADDWVILYQGAVLIQAAAGLRTDVGSKGASCPHLLGNPARGKLNYGHHRAEHRPLTLQVERDRQRRLPSGRGRVSRPAASGGGIPETVEGPLGLAIRQDIRVT